MIITIPESGELDIELFKDLIDISKISYYYLEEKDGIIKLQFYDSEKKFIKPYSVCSKSYKENKNGKENQKSKKSKKIKG